MSYRLFLDDVREPWMVGNYINPVELRPEFRLHEWVIVRNYKDFVETIQEKGLPTHISFDHDLAEEHYSISTQEDWEENYFKGEELSGYDCAQWLTAYCLAKSLPLPIYFIHSMNPVGRENIQKHLKRYENRKS